MAKLNSTTKKKYQVSVIMAVHRHDIHLNEAIKSALNQNDVEFELLIIANNCTDALWQELNSRYSAISRIKLHRTLIPQLAFNLNFGLNLAQHEFVARLDSDDIMRPDRLSLQARFLDENPNINVLGSWAELISTTGDTLGLRKYPSDHKEILRLLPRSNPICHPSVMFRKTAILKAGGYLGGFQSEDYELWIRAGLHHKTLNFHNLPEPLLKYRINPNSTQGSIISYSEVCGHFLKYFILTRKIVFLQGFIIASLKVYLKILTFEGFYRRKLRS